MPIRIVLADDHQIIREGVRTLLSAEKDFEIIGEAEDGKEAIHLVEEKQPDILVMDISMENMDGIEATRQIHKKFPDVRIVALSMYQAKQYVSNMLEAGASGFLLKDCAGEELVTAIRSILKGKSYLSPEISEVVVSDYVNQLKTHKNSVENLFTEREREVLRLVVDGKSTRQIADELFVSVKTIETHRQQIMKKTGLKSIAELTKFAIREGLTGLD